MPTYYFCMNEVKKIAIGLHVTSIFSLFQPSTPHNPPPRKGHSYELSTHIHVSQLDNNCLIKLSCMSVVPAYMDKAGRQRGWESLSLISVSVACLEIPTREEETDGRVVGSPATPALTSRNTVSLSLSFSCCMFAWFNYTNYRRAGQRRRPVMLENPQLRLVATTGFFSIFIFRFSFFFFLLRLFFYFSKVDWVLAAVRKYLENPKWLLDRRGGERFSHDILKACIYHGTGFLKSI